MQILKSTRYHEKPYLALNSAFLGKYISLFIDTVFIKARK